MKIVQSIYQVMQLNVPQNSYVAVGRTRFVFTNQPLKLVKITGKPVRITDEGRFLAPEAGIVSLHPGVYCLIESECQNDSDESERQARESNEICAGIVSLLFGKRACEIHVGDNLIEDGKMSMISRAMRDPRFQKMRQVSLADFSKAVRVFAEPGASVSSHIKLTLNWYMKGRREELGPDAYLSFWIGMEVLFGEWKNLEHKIAERLSRIIPGGFAADLVLERLKIRRLIALRSDIVHKGKQIFTTAEESFQLVIVREILEEILKSELGIVGRDRFSKLISDPGEWSRLVAA